MCSEVDTGTELFEDYAQAYQNLVRICEENNVARDLPKIKAEFAQSNDSWRGTRVKVPNDTYNVENVQGELKRYEEKYEKTKDIVNAAEKVLGTEATAVVDERVALNDWQKVKVRFCCAVLYYTVPEGFQCALSCSRW